MPPLSPARLGPLASHGSPQGRDRRAFPRYQFRINVEIEWGSKALWGHVSDISQQGMFIEIPDLDWVNASFTANLALGIPLRVECVVCRIVPNRGVGVTIVVPDEEKRSFTACSGRSDRNWRHRRLPPPVCRKSPNRASSSQPGRTPADCGSISSHLSATPECRPHCKNVVGKNVWL